MGRFRLTSASLVVVLAVAGVIYTLVAQNTPLLGLDLRGGVSVVLQPTSEADDEALDQTLEIIRSRVDSLGVAEPEISRQGQTIVVDLPGVDEQQRALELVGQTAELRFRPVIPLFDVLDPGLLEAEGTDDGAADDADEGDTEESLGVRYRQDSTTTTESDESSTTTTTESSTTTTTEFDESSTTAEPPYAAEARAACGSLVITPPEADLADSYVLLVDRDGRPTCLGPSQLTGEAVETASVSITGLGSFQVNPVFKSGQVGIDGFNAVAAQCAAMIDTCPTGQLAIVLDGVVISAPVIQEASFSRDRIQITGSFTEEEAQDLATVLRYGALPVELEAQQTRTVSATIGNDVLRSGIVAGIIGLALVCLYLFYYYRLAALVAISGLGLSAMILWTVVAYLGENQGLALTLAGIVGLIVSIGVSADSNIVYFENVKDAARDGRRAVTAVERAYEGAISTILKADVVSLIAAVLLYFLTVGAVKGFAFYLGLATLLDLVISYLFMKPALVWLARQDRIRANPRLLGIPTSAETAGGVS